ncbi:MAG: AAA family ATPase [Desulfobacterales bacterium]|nr:MAG: AAA family ATPase [Desulfobacterales bacterium]
MGTQRQTEIFQAMARPEFYPHAVTAIAQRDTHISKVFLTGPYAYKIKKAVNLEFLDFTTLEKRRHFCRQEVMLNRRLAPDVYLDVIPIIQLDGRYRLGGSGPAVEYAVKMRQLPDDRSMLRLVRRGKLENESLDALARILAEFYNGASTSARINTVGSWETVWTNTEENFRQTERFAGQLLDERIFRIIRAATQTFLIRQKALFERRIDRAKIRDCHGDLRAGHIYFADGIQIIDCIEFNDRFRYADITADLAFLAMDLDYEGYPQIAQRMIEAYLRYDPDPELFVLLDFYKCYRAHVRVKINCFRLQEENLSLQEKSRLTRETRRYLDLAYHYAVRFTRPTIWVICGLPASGKSTLSHELAKTLNAKVLQSDVVRKELFGLQPLASRDLPFEEGLYSPEASSLTYGKLLMLAQEEIEKGASVLLDATFGRRRQRDEATRLARDMDANIIFIECISPLAVLKKRLAGRKAGVAIPDARLHHLQPINASFEPLEELPDEMHIRIDTEAPLEASLRQILAHDYILLARQTARTIKNRQG